MTYRITNAWPAAPIRRLISELFLAPTFNRIDAASLDVTIEPCESDSFLALCQQMGYQVQEQTR